ncbi:MAG: hypothetical protein FWD34_05665 [Oscillospiraceae bacterium]|nr:hypothetical protein [Oscillospiraceae bacterium]
MTNVCLTSMLNYTPAYNPAATVENHGSTSFGEALNKATTATHSTPPPPNTSLRWHEPPSQNNPYFYEWLSMSPEQRHQNNAYAKSLTEKSNQIFAEFNEEIRARTEGKIKIMLGKGEFVELMKALEKAAASGECFTSALEKWIVTPPGEIDRLTVNPDLILSPHGKDFFYIDPDTGDIAHAVHGKGIGSLIQSRLQAHITDDADSDAVWDLAYDLQQFIKAAFFNEEGRSPDEIAMLLKEIKARQDNKCTCRFDRTAENTDEIIDESEDEALIGIINDDEVSVNYNALETGDNKDMISDFIKAIGKHQDKLYDEKMRMNSGVMYRKIK